MTNDRKSGGSKYFGLESLFNWGKDLFFPKKTVSPPKKYPSLPKKKINYTNHVILSSLDIGKPGTVDSSLEMVLPEFKFTGMEMFFDPPDDLSADIIAEQWSPYLIVTFRMVGKYTLSNDGSARHSDHLGKKEVGTGDLLLFVSTFRVSVDDSYSRSEVLCGYFEIDRVNPIVHGTPLQPWQEKHRISPNLNSSCWDDPLNVIITSKKTASWNDKIPGAAFFKRYNADLNLSPKTQTNPPSWRLPLCIEETSVTNTYPIWKDGLFHPYSPSSPDHVDIKIKGTDMVLNWFRDVIEKSI